MSSDKKTSSLLKMRTFAQDLNAARAGRTVPATKPEPPLREEPIPAKEQKPVKTELAKAPITISEPPLKKAELAREKEIKRTPADRPVVRTMQADQSTIERKPAKSKTSSAEAKSAVSLQDSIGKIRTPGSGSDFNSKTPVRDSTYEATIITDAKHDRFSLRRELISSLVNWWKKLKSDRTERRKPKYTVPRADRRKGVIQKATSKTARASTADYSTVLKRIKENQNELPIEKPALLHLPPEENIIETHTEKTLDASEKSISSPKETTVATAEPVPVIKPIIPSIPPPTIETMLPVVDTEPEITPEPEPVLPPAPVAPAEPIEPIEPIALKRIEPLLPFSSEVPPAIETQQVPEKKIETKPKSRLSILSLVKGLTDDPNRLTFFVLCGFTAVFFLYVGIQSFVGNNSPTNIETRSQTAIFSNSTRYQADFIATNKQTLFDQVNSYSDDTTSLYEVTFVSPATKELVPAMTIFEILGTDLPADFTASVDHIVFGYYRGEPWLTLSISNKNTAHGGLLGWESELSKDLEPWFGTAVKNIGNTGFKDGVIGTTDVRVLQSSDGKERITYGFTGNNVVIITTNTTAFLNLKNNLSN